MLAQKLPYFRLSVPSFQRRAVRRSAVMAASKPRKASEDDKLALVNKAQAFIFDCDGVIWRGDSLIEGVPETLDMLRAAGKKTIFVTNNSTKSRAGYKGKFTSLGLAVEPEEIYSSSFAAAAYLEATNFDRSKKVYIVGEVGIEEELDKVGIQYVGGSADVGKVPDMGKGQKVEVDPDVAAVIVGFDRHVNYYKLQYATVCLRELPGCEFIATNLDAVTHLTDAQEWAGNGAMVGAIRGATKREPTVVGKPADFMLRDIAARFALRPEDICMVGDRLDTDILFGKDGGLATALVLSGVTTEEELLSEANLIHPDTYLAALPELLSIKGQLGGARAKEPAAV